LKWTDKDTVESINQGIDDGLVYLYKTHRSEFLEWARKRYQVDHDLASDAFQEAIIALRFNVLHGKLTTLSSTLKTYLFSVAKNQLLNRLKRSNFELSSDDLSKYEGEGVTIMGQQKELSERQERVRATIHSMAEPCLSILKMFYYLGYSMEVIAARMSYKSEDVAKSQKARCFKKLKSAML